MRGPAMDLSSILGGGGGALPFPPMQPPQIASSLAPKKNVRFAPDAKEVSDVIDRLSDVVSEDLDSVPDDLTSVGGMSEDGDIKTVPSIKRKVQKKGSKKTEKTVITL